MNQAAATETLAVVVERDIPHPPEKIWRALTQPHLIEAWLMKSDFKPAVDHRFKFTADWGAVDCKVLAIEPQRTLSYTWAALPGRAVRLAAVLRQARNGAAARGLTMMKKKTATPPGGESPAKLIDGRIKELGDWRGKTLAHVRALIKQADPEVVETWKWRGVPVWEHDGILCTGETYKSVVKMTFAKGASLKDPAGLFNSSLEGNVRRAIDFRPGEKIDEKALKTLVRSAVALNLS